MGKKLHSGSVWWWIIASYQNLLPLIYNLNCLFNQRISVHNIRCGLKVESHPWLGEKYCQNFIYLCKIEQCYKNYIHIRFASLSNYIFPRILSLISLISLMSLTFYYACTRCPYWSYSIIFLLSYFPIILLLCLNIILLILSFNVLPNMWGKKTPKHEYCIRHLLSL